MTRAVSLTLSRSIGAPFATPRRRHPHLATFVDTVSDFFMVAVQGSLHPAAWIWARAALSFPLQLKGPARRYLARIGSHEIHVLSLGQEGRLGLLRRMFEDVRCTERRERAALWSAARSATHGVDMVLCETHPWAARRFRASGWVIIPHAVRWQAPLAAVPPSRSSDSLQFDLRRIRKAEYVLEEARTERDWVEFFQGMWIPQAHARFGNEAWIPSSRLCRQIARRGTLLYVRSRTGRVAGSCVVPIGKMAWSPFAAVRAGDRALVREGALAATYSLSFEWLRERGFEKVDWGRSSPFLQDGVHRYKRKWGLAPVRDPLARLTAVWFDPSCQSLREAFAREPLLVDAGNGLRAYAGEVDV
jgi:hypothetical protein